MVNLGGAFGLHLCFDGVERVEADVGECAGDAAAGCADEGTFEDGEVFHDEGLGFWGWSDSGRVGSGG